MTRIIAIANQKGGVGKTTTAINLSSTLAELNKRVLLIDFDPQGNSTSGLGIDKGKAKNSIYHGIITDISLNSIIEDSLVPNLKIIAADVNLSAAELELPQLDDYNNVLRKKLQPLLPQFDYILIDCPPSLGLLTINALTAAGSVLIPLQCEFFALEGMAQLLNTIKMIRSKLNPNLVLEGILPTMYDQRNNISKQVLLDLKTHFPKQLLKSIIPRNVKLSEAPSHGLPISYYDANSKGAEHYKELAVEIAGATI